MNNTKSKQKYEKSEMNDFQTAQQIFDSPTTKARAMKIVKEVFSEYLYRRVFGLEGYTVVEDMQFVKDTFGVNWESDFPKWCKSNKMICLYRGRTKTMIVTHNEFRIL